MLHKKSLLSLVFLCLLFPAFLAQASWVSLGASLNVTTNQDATSPSIALDGNNSPYVTWGEQFEVALLTNRYQIVVKYWNGATWVQLGGWLNTDSNQSAYNPSVAIDGSNSPYVAWHETDGTDYDLYVKQWNGAS